MKQFSKVFLTYIVAGIFSLAAFSLLLHIDVWRTCEIYLYKSFIYAGITAVLVAALFLLLNKAKPNLAFLDLSPSCIFSAAVICLLALGFFSSTVIMPMDRSYTIYTLAEMADNSEQVYSMEEIEDSFIDVYIKEMQNTERRISEQVEVGSLTEVEGGYQITKKGQQLIEMYRLLDKIYPVDNKTSIYPSDWKK